jgi:segregation and condensation protein A
MPSLDLDVATEFLLPAAVLVELKTRRLLPGRNDHDLEDELGLWEVRDLLIVRLLECKTFKDAAAELERMARLAGHSHPRVAGLEDRFIDLAPDILAGVTATDLAQALVKALTPKPAPRVDLDHVAPIRASVRDALEELVRELPGAQRTTFRQLTAHHRDRLEIIVRFLAVLELYKQGLIEVEQFNNFADIVITWIGGERDAVGQGAWMHSLATIDGYDG